jgi:hypothetical protein
MFGSFVIMLIVAAEEFVCRMHNRYSQAKILQDCDMISRDQCLFGQATLQARTQILKS